jgi:hypothetical protein
MRVELHERRRIGVAALATALGETRQAMARWLRLESCPIQQPGGPRTRTFVYSDDLRTNAPFVWRALLESTSDAPR